MHSQSNLRPSCGLGVQKFPLHVAPRPSWLVGFHSNLALGYSSCQRLEALTDDLACFDTRVCWRRLTNRRPPLQCRVEDGTDPEIAFTPHAVLPQWWQACSSLIRKSHPVERDVHRLFTPRFRQGFQQGCHCQLRFVTNDSGHHRACNHTLRPSCRSRHRDHNLRPDLHNLQIQRIGVERYGVRGSENRRLAISGQPLTAESDPM
mmetsp:Transcript_37780/g.90750  ORF Transcript_37780/g.90750 Transcript_37780/m.90750 type:complete len:205 (+) Transcript_37780:2-616(+)